MLDIDIILESNKKIMKESKIKNGWKLKKPKRN